MRNVRTVGLAVVVLVAALAILVLPRVQSSAVSTSGERPMVPASAIQNAKEVNYYPSAEAWTNMWTSFNPAVIGSDFARIRGLGANTVRIFVEPSVFGYPTVQPAMANELSEVIGLAAQNSLYVHLTLFDLWSQFTDISGSKEWASSLLAPYKNDPRIAVVELHNEIPPQNSQAMAWVATMLPYLSTIMPGTLRTVSTASVSPALFASFVQQLASTPPDFWDYHYYGSASSAQSTLSQIKALAAPLPLFIGETGYSTYGTGTQAALYQAQASYYQAVFTAASQLGLPDPAPWILYDFTPGAIPPAVKTNAAQYDFGLFQADGTAKPAAAVVEQAFSG